MSVALGSINTKTVKGRRTVRYESLSDFLEDAERLANREVQTVGNWSQGQIYEHLARALDIAIDGTDLMPAPMRIMLNLFFKKKFLHKAIPAGFKAPSKFVPEETSIVSRYAMRIFLVVAEAGDYGPDR